MNSAVRKQYKVFKKSVNILNYLYYKWKADNEEVDIDFDYKDEKAIEMITLIDHTLITDNIICMETLWLCTEFSPLRFM